jgi:hypothetical protein
MVGYFTTRVKLHGRWDPKLETSVHRGWIGLLEHSSWLKGADVVGLRTVLGAAFTSFGFTWPLSLPTWG